MELIQQIDTNLEIKNADVIKSSNEVAAIDELRDGDHVYHDRERFLHEGESTYHEGRSVYSEYEDQLN
jgi:hypothetical protein